MIAVLRYYDRALLIGIAALLAVGFVFLYSVSVGGAPYFSKQVSYAAIGVVLCFLAIQRISVRRWRRAAVWILIVLTILLLATVLFGAEKNGARRWLNLLVVSLQPAEFFKFAVLLCAAHWLALTIRDKSVRRHHYWQFACFVPAFILLLAQPDFGTMALLLAVILVMAFLSGCFRPWQLIGVVVLTAVFLTVVVLAKDYRLDRITGFIDPFADPYDTGYHQRMALIALWSGGWWGRGLGRGVGKLDGELPEAHTDFIVTVIAEEIGYVGLVGLACLFAFLMSRIVRVSMDANRRGDVFSALYAFGVVLLITGQAFINIAGNLALIPLKGMTLPLISYGGSSLLSTLIMLSVVLRIDRENHAEQQEVRG